MCKRGDIILVYEYKSQGNQIGKHSFVVIDDENGTIEGLPYDIICNVFSSFKDEKQKQRKLLYPGNFPLDIDDAYVKNGNNKTGYIKAEQFYYFKKSNLKYRVIGMLDKSVFNELIEFINNSDFAIEQITDNL